MAMRNLSIEMVLNGWIVFVGCQRAVFTEHATMMHWLSDYTKHPDTTEAAFLKAAQNRRYLMGEGGAVLANQAQPAYPGYDGQGVRQLEANRPFRRRTDAPNVPPTPFPTSDSERPYPTE